MAGRKKKATDASSDPGAGKGDRTPDAPAPAISEAWNFDKRSDVRLVLQRINQGCVPRPEVLKAIQDNLAIRAIDPSKPDRTLATLVLAIARLMQVSNDAGRILIGLDEGVDSPSVSVTNQVEVQTIIQTIVSREDFQSFARARLGAGSNGNGHGKPTIAKPQPGPSGGNGHAGGNGHG